MSELATRVAGSLILMSQLFGRLASLPKNSHINPINVT